MSPIDPSMLDVFDYPMHMLSSDTTVDHGVLLHKLKDLGITGKLGIWFFQFLTQRTHYVLYAKTVQF